MKKLGEILVMFSASALDKVKYKLGFISGKAAIILLIYVLFSFAELNINILEWAVLSRLIFVVLSIGLFFNQKPTTE